MRTLPAGIDQRSACRHPDWTGPDDLVIKINELREITDWKVPIYVKIGATRTFNDVKLAVHSGADVVVVDGMQGGTAATQTVFIEHVGIPTLAAVRQAVDALEAMNMKSQVQLVVSGGIRTGADVAKALALGADAVSIGQGALFALGCNSETYVQDGQHHAAINDYEKIGTRPGYCHHCHTGRCPVGITTQDPVLEQRLEPEVGARRLRNYVKTMNMELTTVARACGRQRAPPRARDQVALTLRPQRWRDCWRGPTDSRLVGRACDHTSTISRAQIDPERTWLLRCRPSRWRAKVERETVRNRQQAEGGKPLAERYLGNIIRQLRLKTTSPSLTSRRRRDQPGHAVQDRDRPGVYQSDAVTYRAGAGRLAAHLFRRYNIPSGGRSWSRVAGDGGRAPGHQTATLITCWPHDKGQTRPSSRFSILWTTPRRCSNFEHPGTEFIYMLKGRIEIPHGQQTYLLEPGDALSFRGDIPHGRAAARCPFTSCPSSSRPATRRSWRL
jgi:hypothetical protein